jgi:membrane associated rhomboid family serine protease
MLFPYADDNSQIKTFPIVNYTLIGLNILVFVFLQRLGANEIFTNGLSTVPAEILTGKDIINNGSQIYHEVTNHKFELPPLFKTPIPVYLTLITSMFLHGGFGHLFGNMLFLYIYGDNLEDKLGKGRYLVFYLLTGILSGLSHVFATYFQGGNPYIPCLGASGAISGVMGGYLFLFPQNKIRAFFLYYPITIPAAISLVVWIVFQIISGLGTMGGQGGGVAYAAHIGGFIAGFVLIKLFVPHNKKEAFQPRYSYLEE